MSKEKVAPLEEAITMTENFFFFKNLKTDVIILN